MKDKTKKIFERKRNRVIAIALGVCILIVLAAVGVYYGGSAASSEKVHVATVASITGALENGMRNRYAGVVESEDTWSARQDSSREIERFYVKVGDEVKKGDKLFVYDNSEAEESLSAQQIELRRLKDELTSLNEDVKELSVQKKESSDESARAELTVEIQQKQLDIRSKDYEITSKQKEIDKTNESLKNSTVKSKIGGVVKSINDGTAESDSQDAITIVNTRSFRVKAKVNEQNLSSLSENLPVIVFSRVSDDVHWKGTISKIDTKSTATSSADDEEGKDMTSSSGYYFYITLDSFDGMNMGQHVYVEEDVGQLEFGDSAHIELDEYYIVGAEGDEPYVWAAKDNGRLEKRRVVLGKYNEATAKYVIESGLDLTDFIAMPADGLKEGARTIDENAAEEESDGDDYGDDEDYDGDEDDSEYFEIPDESDSVDMTDEGIIDNDIQITN